MAYLCPSVLTGKHIGQTYWPDILARHIGQTYWPDILARHIGQTNIPSRLQIMLRSPLAPLTKGGNRRRSLCLAHTNRGWKSPSCWRSLPFGHREIIALRASQKRGIQPTFSDPNEFMFDLFRSTDTVQTNLLFRVVARPCFAVYLLSRLLQITATDHVGSTLGASAC